MDNPITTLQLDHLRAEVERLRNTIIEWSHAYDELVFKNEQLQERINELEEL